VSKSETQKGLMSELSELQLLEFGSVITRDLVHRLLGIEMPSYAAKEVYDRLAMIELSAIDYCRNILLGQGKYLAGTPAGYRVLLPSENKAQIDSYISSADKKLSRALKLSRNTPVTQGVHLDQTEARIMMKKTGMRHSISTQFQPI